MEAVLTEQRQWTGGEATSLLQSATLCANAQEQAIRLRNQQRIAEALARKPDWEKLKEGLNLVEEIREAARVAGVQDMSMEEIDSEIAAYRKERRELTSK